MAEDFAECHDRCEMAERVVEDEKTRAVVNGQVSFDLGDDAGGEDFGAVERVEYVLNV